MQRLTILGNVGADAEVRTLDQGRELIQFSVAVTHKAGGRDVTTWYRCTGWDERWTKLRQWIRKGSKIYVEGRPSLNVYMDQQANARANIEITIERIEFCGGGQSDHQPQQNSQSSAPAYMNDQLDQPQQTQQAQQVYTADDITKDDLPF